MTLTENKQTSGRKFSFKIHALPERTSNVQVSDTNHNGVKQTNGTNRRRFCTSVRIYCDYYITSEISSIKCWISEAKRE
jgi:hypothetical protein